MKRPVIVDTGPLVAMLNRTDKNHGWVIGRLSEIEPPLFTCEAVLAEASYLTRDLHGARAALIEMVGDGFLTIGMSVAEHHVALLASIKRYASVPMSLADACLVRLAEIYPQSAVLTLDSDFSIYRKNGRHVIERISPL